MFPKPSQNDKTKPISSRPPFRPSPTTTYVAPPRNTSSVMPQNAPLARNVRNEPKIRAQVDIIHQPMTPRRATFVLLALLGLLCAARGVPTTDQIRGMLADKQYKRVLREVARAMALKGDDAAAY